VRYSSCSWERSLSLEIAVCSFVYYLSPLTQLIASRQIISNWSHRADFGAIRYKSVPSLHCRCFTCQCEYFARIGKLKKLCSEDRQKSLRYRNRDLFSSCCVQSIFLFGELMIPHGFSWYNMYSWKNSFFAKFQFRFLNSPLRNIAIPCIILLQQGIVKRAIYINFDAYNFILNICYHDNNNNNCLMD